MKVAYFFIFMLISPSISQDILAVNLSQKLPIKLVDCNSTLLKCLKNVSASYLLAVTIVMMHESGHALMSKLLYGSSSNIEISMLPCGCRPNDFYFRLRWFKFSGFKPPFGQHHNAGPTRRINAFNNAIITVAGPVAGTLFSTIAYIFIKKYASSYTIAKSMALFGVFGNSIGQILSATPAKSFSR